MVYLFKLQINSGTKFIIKKNFISTIIDWTDLFTNKLGNFDSLKVMGTDLLSLTLVKTPKEMGAHVTYGNS